MQSRNIGNAQQAIRTRKRKQSMQTRGARNHTYHLSAGALLPLLSRDVNAYEPGSSHTQRETDIALRFIELTRPLRIRDGYTCASLAEARALLEEAGSILGAFANLEQIGGNRAATTNDGSVGAAADAFLAHPILASMIPEPNRAASAQPTSLPDYGAVADIPDRPVDAPTTDIKGLLALNRDLLDSYFSSNGSTHTPTNDIRTAVACTLLTAAGGAMEAALGYLLRVFDIGTIQLFAAYQDVATSDKPGTLNKNSELLFHVAGSIDTFAQRLPLLMTTGHNTLTHGKGQPASVQGNRPEQAVSSVIQGAHTASLSPLERKQQMSHWLGLQDLFGYVSEFGRPLDFNATPVVQPNFRFATHGVTELARVLAALEAPQLASISDQVVAFRASRQRRARREEVQRERALSVSVVDPNRPLSISGLAAALGYLANEPGESGSLTIDCEASAQIKLLTAKVSGKIRMGYRMSNWGSLMLGIEAGASARLGIGAGVVDAGVNGEAAITRSHKFTNHEQAARFIYASLRNWVETLSNEVGPAVWNYLYFEDVGWIDPSRIGKTITDTKHSAGADATGKLGSTKLGGAIGKTWIDRHCVDENGKESRTKISFGSASVWASAKAGNLGVGVDASATLGEWVKAGEDTPLQFLSLGAGIDLTFSGGLRKDASAWEKGYSQASKNDISKAVGTSLERVRVFLITTFPQLATSPSLTRKAWKSLRKDIIGEINKSAKDSHSTKMQFNLTANLTQEARGTTETGELDTTNKPYVLSYMRLMLTSSHKRSTGVNAKVVGVSGNTTVSKAENLRMWLGNNSMGYCKALYKASGSKPGVPTGLWKQLLEENPSEAFESMYGAVWNEGKGPIGVGSAGEDFFELFLRMKEDELTKPGTVRRKTTNQAPEYLTLLENCLEHSSGSDVPDLATIADLDTWNSGAN